MTSPAFLAADWGTTNLRAWVVDDDGSIAAHREFALGVAKLAPGEPERRLAEEVRPALGAQGLPAILCGMIGSTLGWVEVPYLDCPAGLDDLAAGLHRVGSAQPAAAIVPGLRALRPNEGGPDVMRGEETQILGWAASDPARLKGRHLICHPGTHAKWVLLQDGRIERFVTAMTGELFDVLSRHSVLRSEPGPEDAAAFGDGLAAAGDGGALAARLFTTRAKVVGGGMAPASASARSYLSGLLIGAEVAATPALLGADLSGPVALIGDPVLTGLYRRALERIGAAVSEHDGEVAGLAGLTALYQRGMKR